MPLDKPPTNTDSNSFGMKRWFEKLQVYVNSLSGGGGGGTGTVTSIGTNAPITGGTITTTGSISVSDFTGDSGAGGARGTVPAPASGDAASGKFLSAGGTWLDPFINPSSHYSLGVYNSYLSFKAWDSENVIGTTGVGCTFRQAGSSNGNVALTGASFFTSLHKFGWSTNSAVLSCGGYFDCEVVQGATGFGGFNVGMIFAPDHSTATTSRMWCGLHAGHAAPTPTTEPSTNTNCIFIGCDSTDTNLQLMYNDGAGTCTKQDLGVSWPARASGPPVYLLLLEGVGGGNGLYSWSLTRMDTNASLSGSINLNTPTSTTVMVPKMHMGPNAAINVVMYLARGYVMSAF